MASQTYLLSDDMLCLYDSIKKLNFSYVIDHKLYFKDNGRDFYQQASFYLNLDNKKLEMTLASLPERIVVLEDDKSRLAQVRRVWMEEFLERVPPELAEVLYFNIDLWNKF